MSGPKPLGDSLTAGQADLIGAMQAVGAMTLVELCAITGVGRTMAMRHLADLRSRDLVTQDKPVPQPDQPKSGHPAWLYSLTAAGGRALLRHQRKQEDAANVVVPPPTFTTAGQPPWQPPKDVYYRNGGNRHIASAGVPC